MATIVRPWFSCSPLTWTWWTWSWASGTSAVTTKNQDSSFEMMRRYIIITNYLLEDPFGSMVSPCWNRVEKWESQFLLLFQRVHDVLDIDDGKDSWNYYPENVEWFNASLDDSISQISMKSQATVATNRLSSTRHNSAARRAEAMTSPGGLGP